VLADRGEVVVTCSDEEYQAAQKEEREPVGLGFHPLTLSLPAKNLGVQLYERSK
jgi:hypothetical protein